MAEWNKKIEPPYTTYKPFSEGSSETIPYTRELVASQYADAKAYAQEAWEKALEYIDDLNGHLTFTFALNVPDFHNVNINSDVRWTNPPVAPDASVDSIGQPGAGEAEWQGNNHFDEIRTALKSWLKVQLTTGGTGLNSDVEDAIYYRARNRMELQRESRIDETENYWSSRNHTRPPGVLDKQIRAINEEESRNLTDLNRDIVVQQVTVEQNMVLAALERSINFGSLNLEEQVEKSKFVLDKFLKLVQAYDIRAKVEIAEAEARTNIYSAQVRAYAAETEAEKTKIEAEIAEAQAKVQQEIAESNFNIERARLELQQSLAQFELEKTLLDSKTRVTERLMASAFGTVQTSAGVRYGFDLNNSFSRQLNASVSTDKRYTISGSQET